MEGILKVNSEQLAQTAAEFGSKAGIVGNLTTEMMNIVTSLASVWEGEASASYVAKFKGLDNDIQMLVKMVQEHSTDLEEMARVYEQAENQNVEEFSSLASDVLV